MDELPSPALTENETGTDAEKILDSTKKIARGQEYSGLPYIETPRELQQILETATGVLPEYKDQIMARITFLVNNNESVNQRRSGLQELVDILHFIASYQFVANHKNPWLFITLQRHPPTATALFRSETQAGEMGKRDEIEPSPPFMIRTEEIKGIQKLYNNRAGEYDEAVFRDAAKALIDFVVMQARVTITQQIAGEQADKMSQEEIFGLIRLDQMNKQIRHLMNDLIQLNKILLDDLLTSPPPTLPDNQP